MPTPTPKAEARLVRAIQKASTSKQNVEVQAQLSVLAAAAQAELTARPTAVSAPVQAAAARPGMVERGKQFREEARKLRNQARAAADPVIRGQLQGRAELLDIESDKMNEEAALARDGILVVPAQAAAQVQAEETRLHSASGSQGRRPQSAATQAARAAAQAENAARYQARQADRAARQTRTDTTAVRGQTNEPPPTKTPEAADTGPNGASGAGGPPGAVPEYLPPTDSVVTPPVSSEEAPIQTSPPPTEHPPPSASPPGSGWKLPEDSPPPPAPGLDPSRPAEPPGVLITSNSTSDLTKKSALRTYGPWVLGGAAVAFLLWRANKKR